MQIIPLIRTARTTPTTYLLTHNLDRHRPSSSAVLPKSPLMNYPLRISFGITAPTTSSVTISRTSSPQFSVDWNEYTGPNLSLRKGDSEIPLGRCSYYSHPDDSETPQPSHSVPTNMCLLYLLSRRIPLLVLRRNTPNRLHTNQEADPQKYIIKYTGRIRLIIPMRRLPTSLWRPGGEVV